MGLTFINKFTFVRNVLSAVTRDAVNVERQVGCGPKPRPQGTVLLLLRCDALRLNRGDRSNRTVTRIKTHNTPFHEKKKIRKCFLPQPSTSPARNVEQSRPQRSETPKAVNKNKQILPVQFSKQGSQPARHQKCVSDHFCFLLFHLLVGFKMSQKLPYFLAYKSQ